MSSSMASVAYGRTGEHPTTLLVKNTFIVARLARSPSLDDFFQERRVCSCPGSPVSRFAELSTGSSEGAGAPFEVDVGSSRSTADTEEEVPVDRRRSEPHLSVAHSMRTVWPGQEAQRVHPGTTSTDWEMRLGPRPPWRQRGSGALATSCAGLQPRGALAVSGAQLPLGASLPAAFGAQLPEEASVKAGRPMPQDISEFPSIGSAGHYVGQCKPCAFVHTDTCSSGYQCVFCHLCEAGEKRRRQKEKRAFKIAARETRNARRLALAATNPGYPCPPRVHEHA